MVNKSAKEHDRRSKLSDYLYGLSTLFVSGTGIGGLSPMVSGDKMGFFNYFCIVIGTFVACIFAYCANRIMNYN